MMERAVLMTLACVLAAGGSAGEQPAAKNWLDRPLTSWNEPVRPLPTATPAGEAIAAMTKRCNLAVRRGTAAERAMADAGWLPYLHVDREIIERDVEIIGAMTGADGMCRPSGYNIFVFVGGRFAGTLAPLAMPGGGDGTAGAVRLGADDLIVAEFARYGEGAPACCPTGRVRVRYRIDRAGAQAVVIPVSLQSAPR